MNYKITILLFIALLSVSTSPIMAKSLIGVSAIAISFWRMFIASLLIWIYSAYKNQGRMQKSSNYYRTILAGLLLGIHFALFFSSIKLTLVSNATFLGTLAPLFTLLLELVVLKRKINYKVIIGLLFSLIGAIIIFGNNFDLSREYTKGNILAILCSLCLALSFMIAEKVRQTENTIIYTRMLYLSASLTLLIIAFLTNTTLYGFSNYEYFGLIFLGIVPTIIGHNAIYYSVKYVSPTIVSAFPLGEPVIATILASIIFGELILFNIYIGGAMTLLGLIIIVMKK
jgi:drug/metabolite transporter (DMT)-like permease